MDTQPNKTTSPLMWAAGIAIILFCGAGIAAMMGWIPVSMSRNSEGAAPMADRTPTPQPGAAGPANAPRPTSSYEPRPEPVMGANAPRPRPYEPRTDPVMAANAPAPRVPMKCTECGVIESTREVSARGQTTGLGAVGGAVVGGVLGNQVGSGRGQDIATVVGAVGGVIAGNEIEKRVKAAKGYEVTVRLDNGSTRVLSQASVPSWRAGDRVRVVDGEIRAN